MRYGKIIRFALLSLMGAILLYGAANLTLGLWAYPAQPLPQNCPGVSAPIGLMPEPKNIFLSASFPDNCPFIPIAVLNNGAHTDFLLPAIVTPFEGAPISWPDIFPVPQALAAQTERLYVYIGWGEREFYISTPTWGDTRLSLLLRAAAGASSALHVEYSLPPDLSGLGDDCAILQLSLIQYTRLAQFISAAARRDAAGRALRINAPGYGPYDAFYEANGLFSALNTCNTWTANALHAAGQRAPRWTTLSWFVLHQLRGN